MNQAIYPFHHGEENKLTLFLEKRPAVTQVGIRDNLERGTFLLKLTYCQPGDFSHHSGKKVPFELVTAELVVMDRSKEIVISSGNAVAGELTLLSVLTVSECDDVYAAYSGHESKMHIRSKCKIGVNGILTNIESVIRLDILLRDYKYDKYQNQLMKIAYKYFDPVQNEYCDMPAKYLVNGSSRGIASSTAFLNQHKITSMQVVAKPTVSNKLSAAHLATTGIYNEKIRLHMVDDWEMAIKPNGKIKDYPIVNDNTADFWINRNNNQEWLAIPGFTIVAPALSQDFTNSPFSFVFRNLGPDQGGKPVLEGEIKLTVSQAVTDEIKTQAAKVDSAKTIREISLQNISFTLGIPYIGADQVQKNLLVTTQESANAGDGKTSLIFRLNNNAVRACYSSISSDTSQQGYLPLKLSIDISFYGYSVEERNKLNFANIVNSRISAIPIVRLNQRAIDGDNYFDSATNRLIKKNGEVVTYSDTAIRDVTPKAQMAKIQAISKIHSSFVSNVIHPDVQLIHSSVLPVLPPLIYKLQTYQRSIALDVSFPCTTFGNYYQENNAEDYSAVGCRQAYKLGDPPDTLYSEITALNHSSYKVYRSTISPNQFVIKPVSYIIGRHSPGENSINDYKPCIILYSTIDVVNNTSRWVLDFTLMPDISISDRLELEYTLKEYTPYLPDIQYITEIPVTDATAVLSISRMEDTTLSTYPMDKGIRVTIETKIEAILILLEMLKRNAIDGTFSFTLEDKSVFTVQLNPMLNHIGGIWETGHVELQSGNPGNFLKNISESRINLSKIRFYLKDKLLEQNFNVAIESQATLPLNELPDGVIQWAAYYSQEDPVVIELEQINKYIEDVKCQLIFITLIDFKAKNISEIGIGYRLKDSSEQFNAVLDAVNNNCEKMLLMPITNFLAQRIIEYRVSSVTPDGGAPAAGNGVWITHDLALEGNIINIQSNLITN